MRVRIVLAPAPPYRYHGQITDAAGAPVPGAEVTFGVSAHPIPRTFGDDHHFEHATTGADGAYEIQLGSRFVRGFVVQKDGYARLDHWGDDKGEREEMFAPGRHDFSLKPTSAPNSDAREAK